jgi:signal transduction histidine kinase
VKPPDLPNSVQKPTKWQSSAAGVTTTAGVFFILAVAVITSVLVTMRYNAVLTSAGRELRTLDALLAEESDRSLQSVRLLVDDVVEQIRLKGVVSPETLASQMGERATHDLLRSRLAGVPQLDAITIINTRGFIVNFSRRWPVADNDLSDRDYFSSIRDGKPGMLYLSKPLVDRATNMPTVYLGRRISAPDDGFVGIVLAAVTLSHFDRFYSSLDLAPGDSVALWRDDGILLTRFPATGSPSALPLRSFVSPPVKWRGLEGVYEDTSVLDGGQVETNVAASAKAKQFPLYVTISRNKWTVLESWRRDAAALIAAGVLIAAAIGALLWGMLRHLKTLERAAQLAKEREQAVLARQEIEDVLRQSQKMEVVGQLTGGLAHDFNNVLTVVTSVLSIIRRKLEKGDTNVQGSIDRALDATDRAAGLTRRLLALSRQNPSERMEVYPTELLRGLGELIVHALENTLEFDLIFSGDLWSIKVDPSQLENVILNLAVNARDAMPKGGALRIVAENQAISRETALAEELDPGEYVVIVVSDTGSGMSPEVLARAFEPFYTTKAVGKGTGLGLSQVKTFAKQSGGEVRVTSKEGFGTTFVIYLPKYGHGHLALYAPEPASAQSSFSALETISHR